MLDRKLILRILLVALGIAGVAGAAAILLGTSDIIGRVAGTALTVAFACGFMLPLSVMIDRAQQRPAGLFGMTAVVIEFILIMMLIWEPFGSASGYWGSVLGTAVSFAAAALFAMAFLVAVKKSIAKLAGKLGLVLTILALLLILTAIWGEWLNAPAGYSHPWYYNLAETSGALAGTGILAVGALVGVGTGVRRHWGWFGVAAAALGFVMATVAIWNNLHDTPATLITVLSVAVVFAHANLLSFCPLKPGQHWLLIATIAATIATALLVDINAFWPDWNSPFARWAGAAGILAACGTLALVVLSRINRGVNVESFHREFRDIVLNCPRCGRHQTLPLGTAACTACGLRISTQVEEPRCHKCGYNLYMLTSNRCPECGETIAPTPPPTPQPA